MVKIAYPPLMEVEFSLRFMLGGFCVFCLNGT